MTVTPPFRAGPLDAGFTMLAGLMEAGRIMPARLRAPDNSIPLTILSGFLGAGKTTLVNRLLANPEGRRIVVIVNDFGSLDIDAQLIRARSASTISLANGCACCTVAGDLTRTLVHLAQSADPVDAVLLEASGLADPTGIAQIGLANPAMRLDGVVTVVDAETLAVLSADPEVSPLLRAQIDAADLLVLNKIDLPRSGVEDSRMVLQHIAGNTPVVEATQADVPASIVLGIGAGNADRVEASHEVDTHRKFHSWNLSWSAPLAGRRFREALAQCPRGVLRAKGILHFDDESDPHVYQRVGNRWSLVPAELLSAEDATSRLVVIAPDGGADVVNEWVRALPAVVVQDPSGMGAP